MLLLCIWLGWNLWLERKLGTGSSPLNGALEEVEVDLTYGFIVGSIFPVCVLLSFMLLRYLIAPREHFAWCHIVLFGAVGYVVVALALNQYAKIYLRKRFGNLDRWRSLKRLWLESTQAVEERKQKKQ